MHDLRREGWVNSRVQTPWPRCQVPQPRQEAGHRAHPAKTSLTTLGMCTSWPLCGPATSHLSHMTLGDAAHAPPRQHPHPCRTGTMGLRPAGDGPCGAAAPPGTVAPGFWPGGPCGAAGPPWHSPRSSTSTSLLSVPTAVLLSLGRPLLLFPRPLRSTPSSSSTCASTTCPLTLFTRPVHTLARITSVEFMPLG